MKAKRMSNEKIMKNWVLLYFFALASSSLSIWNSERKKKMIPSPISNFFQRKEQKS